MEEKYIMMSMDDDRMKHLSSVLGNPTAKKIIALLSQKDASETDIANDLQMPVNTVEYNLQKLVAAGLVEKAADFFWSVKGKKIPIYKLSRKYIVISPKPKSRVSGFFATLVLSGIAAVLVGLYEKSQTSSYAVEAVKSSAPMLGAENAVASTNAAVGASLGSIALWFLAGSLFALIVLMLLRKTIRR